MSEKQNRKFWNNDNVSNQDLKETIENLSTSEVQLFVKVAKQTNMVLPEPLKQVIRKKLE